MTQKIIDGNLKKKKILFPPMTQTKKRCLYGVGTALSGLLLFSASILATPVGRVQTIRVEGNHVLNKQDILKQLSVDWNQSIFQLDLKELATRLESDPLIKTAMVARKGITDLSVKIQEQPLVGCLEINQYYYYVLESGESVTNQEATACQGITFKGIETEEGLDSLRLFVQILEDMDASIRTLIKEVVYEPLYGDLNRFSLFLADGNTIKVNTYTMVKKMAYYPMLLSQVHQVYGDVKGVFHLDVGDSFNPYRDENTKTEVIESSVESDDQGIEG